jgi:hypothetical protein
MIRDAWDAMLVDWEARGRVAAEIRRVRRELPQRWRESDRGQRLAVIAITVVCALVIAIAATAA